MGETTIGGRALGVAIYSDYTCPWCYIGSARMDRLRAELEGVVDLSVDWKPFEIHPEIPAEGVPVSALGYPPQQWEAMTANLRRQAESEGLAVAEHTRVSNTHDALVASAYVQAEVPERFHDFHRGLFRAYFGKNRNIADRGVLAEVARGAGLDADAVEAAIESGDYEAALAETTASARRLGITGTPTFVFGGRYAAVGAQPVAELKRAVERALAG
jgi:predicted DsbA family dithiol-disulfide isomerase